MRTYQPTSAEAWASVQAVLPAVDARIVAEIMRVGGATCQAVEKSTGMAHQTVSAQICHMVEGEILRKSGRREKVDSGRSAAVWELNSQRVEPRQARLL